MAWSWGSGLGKSLPLRVIPRPLSMLFYYYVSWVFFIFVRWPLSVFCACLSFALAVCLALSRQNSHTQQMAIHVAALSGSLARIWESLINVQVSELLLTLFVAFFEVFSSWTPSGPRSMRPADNLSFSELNDLLSYEELDDDSTEQGMDPAARRKMRSSMHHYIPANPFRAVTRAPHDGDQDSAATTSAAAAAAATATADDVDSPASFPPTPFSRARVMSHSTERVVSTMFAARDRLRIEAQSASRDEYSRRAAMEAQTSGAMAVFDPRQTSDGLALTCGNHCALKVGRALCCSTRSMIPVRPNTFVYLEFSVTAQSGQVPSLALGLAPPDCPLNVMVGSWPASIGLHSDGQLLIGSRWFDARGSSIEAGSTIGILVFLPGGSGHEGDATTSTTRGEEKGKAAKLAQQPPPTTATATAVRVPSATAASIARARDKDDKDKDKDRDRDRDRDRCGGESQRQKSRSPSTNPHVSTLSAASASLDQQDAEAASAYSLCVSPAQSPRAAQTSLAEPEISVPTSFLLRLSVNGRPLHPSPEACEAACAVASVQQALFPPISLLSQDTRVWCRLCEADIVYRKRASCGAPPGVRVYCLDGSLLLDESA